MEYKRRIFGYECDVYGHMNNANYLKIYEEARADALEQMEMPIRKLRDMGISIYITGLEMKFKKGIPLEERITVISEVTKLNKAISVWEQKIFDEKDELCNTVVIKGAFVQNEKVQRLPENIYEHFLKYKE